MAGIDELHGLIQQALNGSGAYCFGKWKEGIVLMRYIQDTSLNYDEFKKMNRKILKLS